MATVSASESNGPPPPALMGAIMKFGQDAMQAGVLVEQGGLMPSAALQWTRRLMELHRGFWLGWEGTAELRQIFEPPR